MSFTFVQSSVFNNQTTGSLTSAFGSSNTLGNLLVLGAVAIGGGAISGVTDSQGNTWVKAPNQSVANAVNATIWYVLSCKAGANTITVTTSGARTEIRACEYTPSAPASLDISVLGSGSVGSTSNSATISVANNGELVVLIAGNDSSGQTFTGTGITTNTRHTPANNFGFVDGTNVSAGAGQVASGTWSGSVANSSTAAAFSATPVFTISGNTQLPSVTVSWTGTSSGSVVSDASGNYTIINLAAGSYTITPTHTGNTFSPANSAQTITSSNITGINFTIATGSLIAVRQKSTGFVSGSGATVTQTYPVANVAGNFLVALVAYNASYDATGITDTLGNTWLQAGGQNGANVAIFYVANSLAGANTVTLHKSGGATGALAIAEYVGISTTHALDSTCFTSSLNSALGGSCQINQVANAGNLCVVVHTQSSAQVTFSAPSAGYNFEAVPLGPSSIYMWADNTNSVSGTNAFSCTTSISDTTSEKMAVFLAATQPAPHAGFNYIRTVESINKTLSTISTPVAGPGSPSPCIFPGGNNAGNLILACTNQFFPGTTQVTGVSDTAGNTYVPIASFSNPLITTITTIWACQSCVGTNVLNTVSAAWTNAGISDSVDIVAIEYSGQSTGTLFDKAVTSNGTGGAVSYSITPAKTGCLLFTFNSTNSGPETWTTTPQINRDPSKGVSNSETNMADLLSAPAGPTTITATNTTTEIGSLTVSLFPFGSTTLQRTLMGVGV